MRPDDFDNRPARRMLRDFTWATVVIVIASLIGLVVIVAIGILVGWALSW